jgi:pyridoxine kinase
MNILSIQSWVAYGHVGNSSAMFPLQRMGFDVWAVNTVQFSNHPGYGRWKGQIYTGESVRELIDGIDERGALARCDGILSGYMGDADIGSAILDATARVRARNPDAIYLCDPVIGDVGTGVFVRPGIPELMRDQAAPAADILTPNHFELEYLSDMKVTNLADLRRAAAAIHAKGPSIIMVTSLVIDQTPHGKVDIMVSANGELLRVRTPRLDVNVNGAGDAIAALFLGKFLQTGSAEAALQHASSAVFGLLQRTAMEGSREILIVAAQDEFLSPSHLFPVERLA